MHLIQYSTHHTAQFMKSITIHSLKMALMCETRSSGTFHELRSMICIPKCICWSMYWITSLFMETYITNSLCNNALQQRHTSPDCELRSYIILHIIISIFLPAHQVWKIHRYSYTHMCLFILHSVYWISCCSHAEQNLPKLRAVESYYGARSSWSTSG